MRHATRVAFLCSITTLTACSSLHVWDPIVDAPANHDAPALDASCINVALRFEGDDWLSVPDSDQIVQTHVLAHRDPADVGGYD